MAKGDLKDVFPPGNNGTSNGVGIIVGEDGNQYVFQTPRDNNNQVLTVNSPIYFTLVNGKHVESVSQDSSNPIGEA